MPEEAEEVQVLKETAATHGLKRVNVQVSHPEEARVPRKSLGKWHEQAERILGRI